VNVNEDAGDHRAYTITGPAKNLIEFAGEAQAEGVETTIGTFVRGESTNLFIETVRGVGIRLRRAGGEISA
jgi:hypothetical protein